jgi:hypothetical protein
MKWSYHIGESLLLCLVEPQYGHHSTHGSAITLSSLTSASNQGTTFSLCPFSGNGSDTGNGRCWSTHQIITKLLRDLHEYVKCRILSSLERCMSICYCIPTMPLGSWRMWWHIQGHVKPGDITNRWLGLPGVMRSFIVPHRRENPPKQCGCTKVLQECVTAIRESRSSHL